MTTEGYICRLSGVPLARGCSGSRCHRCGWNPAVAARRRAVIRRMAEKDALCFWGGRSLFTEPEGGEDHGSAG